jgi:16S rRNA (uracil1498-N3)-methyltransferase
MTERRFRVEGPWAEGAKVALGTQAAHHAKVLRLGAGDAVVLFDGEGREADATLVDEHDGLAAHVVRVRTQREPWSVILVAGLPKAAVLEQVLRGATEAGAGELRLFVAERSVAQADADRAAKKLERWRRIVEEAARQSERARVPTITLHEGLREALALRPDGATVLALDAREGQDVREVLERATQPCFLVIGPEGGLGPTELALVTSIGGALARAPLPVMRVETAAAVLTALAALAAPRPSGSHATPHTR